MLLPRAVAVLALSSVFLAAAPIASAESDSPRDLEGWELAERDRRAGWALYTRPEPGSDYLRYRLVGSSDQPIERVVRALRLKSTDDRYLGKGQQREILERGDDYTVSHMHIDAPFIADRDAILQLRWGPKPDTGTYRVEWGQPNRPLPPVADGVVRIVSEGSWDVTTRSDGGTDLVYSSHSELGDSVPAWLVNRLMNDQIVNELLVLQQILDSDLPDVAAAGPTD